MKEMLLNDAMGSMLHRFFSRSAETHEGEERLADQLWRSVNWYRQTGEFSLAVVVCPRYSNDYTALLSGVSVTARRAVHLLRGLKSHLKRHMRYTSKVHFRVLLFDQEHRQFELMGISPETAEARMDESVREIQRLVRKDGLLPQSFRAERLVGSGWQDEWTGLFAHAENLLRQNGFSPDEPFSHPDIVFKGMRDFYRRVMNTDDEAAHRRMFETEEAPGYLIAGHLLRKKFGAHTLQVDIGSNAKLAEMNLWQPAGERLTEHPSLIRIKNPSRFDTDI